jgi:Domain of unknown function (DUF4157)/Bacterial toxin 4
VRERESGQGADTKSRDATRASRRDSTGGARPAAPTRGRAGSSTQAVPVIELGAPDDSAERHADALAARALGGGGGGDAGATMRADPRILRRKGPCGCGGEGCSGCGAAPGFQAGRIGTLDRSAVAAALAGPGSMLEPAVRARLESGFGRDFGDVRVHDGAAAWRASDSLAASAWTLGSDIAFAEGAYRPGTPEGDRLIAHELAHVVHSDGDGTVLRRQTQPGCLAAAPETLDRQRGQNVNPPVNVGIGNPVVYVFWETYRAGDTPRTWGDRAIRLWTSWRFGRQSAAQQAAVVNYLMGVHGEVRAASPQVGCHYPTMLDAATYATCMRLSGETARPRPAAGAAPVPASSGAPEPAAPPIQVAGQAPPAAVPSPRPDSPAPVPAGFTSEIPAPPGAPAGRYALPPLPASIAGLDIQPIGGTGTYVMNVDWASVGRDLLGQVAEARLGATYQWEVWDVTGAPLVAQAEREVRSRLRLAHAPDARARIATRGGGAARDLERAHADLARRPAQIAADQRAALAEGRYADALADELNRRLLPLEELTRYGRELLGGAGDLAGSDRDRRIDWPRAGVFVIRCIARVRREAASARAPSVATKLVTTRSVEAASRAALDLPAQQAQEARDAAYVLASMGGDPAEIARMRSAAERSDRQATGTPLQIVEGELAEARAELAEARRVYAVQLEHGLHPERVSRLNARVEQLQQRRDLFARRAGELGAGGATVSRVRAALVSRVTGETYQLLLQLAGRQVGTEWTVVLSDVTTADGRPYEGSAPIGSDLAAAQNAALDRALGALTDRSEYGDASLTVELPGDGWLASVPRDRRRRTLTVRGSPGGWLGARARLGEVATAMAILGLALGSGGVAVAGGLIGAGLAADNIARRWREGTLRPDSQLVGDLLDVLGAVAMGMRAIGALSVSNRSGGGVILRAARALGAAGTAIDTASDVGGVIIANAEMMNSLLETAAAERRGDLAPSEARRARLSAIASGLQSNALTIAGHLGARRMLDEAPDASPAPTRRGSADAPSPREGAAPGGSAPPAPVRTMTGTSPTGGGGGSAPPVRTPANHAAHTAWIDATLASGMGLRPPPVPRPNAPPVRIGETQYRIGTMAEALRIYDDFRARAPGREVGIYHHAETGEYAVVAGREGSVSGPLESRRAGQRWADTGEWANVLHNHPNPGNVLTYRNPAPADVHGTWREALAAGRPVTAFIEHDMPGGGRRYTVLRVHPDGRVVVAFVGEGGRPSVRGFPNLAAYAADWGGRTRYAEPGSSGYRDLIADVEAWQRDRSQSGGLPAAAGDGSRTMAGSGPTPPAAAAVPLPAPAAPAPAAAAPAATAAPTPVVPRIVDPAGRLGGFAISDFDRRTAGTGGISDISFMPDPAGRFAVRITGVLRRGLWRRGGTPPPGRPRAPNYNRSSSLVTHAEAGLPAGQWENLHLVGPGFGDEAAAGMMKGPREVNQWHQNRGVEGWMRDLFRAVDPLNGRVRYEATAVAWDLNDGGWQPAMQTDFLRRAQYRVTVELPNRPARTITINIEVERPPSSRAHISVEPANAINPAHLLDE